MENFPYEIPLSSYGSMIKSVLFVQVLVCTNLASRGLDFDVDHVVRSRVPSLDLVFFSVPLIVVFGVSVSRFSLNLPRTSLIICIELGGKHGIMFPLTNTWNECRTGRMGAGKGSVRPGKGSRFCCFRMRCGYLLCSLCFVA